MIVAYTVGHWTDRMHWCVLTGLCSEAQEPHAADIHGLTHKWAACLFAFDIEGGNEGMCAGRLAVPAAAVRLVPAAVGRGACAGRRGGRRGYLRRGPRPPQALAALDAAGAPPSPPSRASLSQGSCWRSQKMHKAALHGLCHGITLLCNLTLILCM